MNLNDYISYIDIPKHIPINNNDILLIGSDLTHLAMMAMRMEKEFSANLLINSFQNVLSNGTILVPAFISNLEKITYYQAKSTTPETGTLSTTAFKRNDFLRTYDPLHSFLVWGKHTDKLISLKNNSTFGENSVFDFLYKNNSKMLLIDISLEHSFTFAHYVEEQKKVTYRKYKTIKYNRLEEDNKETVESVLFYARKDGYENNFNWLSEKFIQNKISINFVINEIPFSIIDLHSACSLIEKEISNGKMLAKFLFKQFLLEKFKKISKMIK